VPKSKVRKKSDAAVRLESRPAAGPARTAAPSPPWYPVVMSAILVIGLAYVVVWYFAPNNPLMNGLGYWNLAVGFAIMILGLIMAVRWR
jgi:hydrogenase-4 membrane subunit HyfE